MLLRQVAGQLLPVGHSCIITTPTIIKCTAKALHRHLQGTWSATPSTAVGQETAIVTGSGERGGIGKLVAVAVRIYRERPNSIDTHAQMYPFFNNKYNCRILFTLSKDTARA